MTQQQPTAIFVLAPLSRKSIKFQGTEIRFITTKQFFGYKKERYLDFDIFISDREKTIIDLLLFKLPIHCIDYALNDENLNSQKLVDYAQKIKDKSLIKRLGYLLEHKKGQSYGLKPLDNNYVRLDCWGKNKGKKDKKWKLIINL